MAAPLVSRVKSHVLPQPWHKLCVYTKECARSCTLPSRHTSSNKARYLSYPRTLLTFLLVRCTNCHYYFWLLSIGRGIIIYSLLFFAVLFSLIQLMVVYTNHSPLSSSIIIIIIIIFCPLCQKFFCSCKNF